jgi:hypothetical protein
VEIGDEYVAYIKTISEWILLCDHIAFWSHNNNSIVAVAVTTTATVIKTEVHHLHSHCVKASDITKQQK